MHTPRIGEDLLKYVCMKFLIKIDINFNLALPIIVFSCESESRRSEGEAR